MIAILQNVHTQIYVCFRYEPCCITVYRQGTPGHYRGYIHVYGHDFDYNPARWMHRNKKAVFIKNAVLENTETIETLMYCKVWEDQLSRYLCHYTIHVICFSDRVVNAFLDDFVHFLTCRTQAALVPHLHTSFPEVDFFKWLPPC